LGGVDRLLGGLGDRTEFIEGFGLSLVGSLVLMMAMFVIMLPFLAKDICRLAVLVALPAIATSLPGRMYEAESS
jgi:hypothetical protein